MKRITIGFSPCPNDTFIFDALINNRIDTGNYVFEPLLEDVEQLNKLAQHKKLDVTKLSVGAFAGVSEDYIILESGSALGSGVGPLLVSLKENTDLAMPFLKIAIPGKSTTANLLLSIFYPHLNNKIEVLFSNIEHAILKGEADAGLLIHEGRFTYQKHGLINLLDLGTVWENNMKVPLPLGCICASRELDLKTRNEVNNLIRASINHAMKNPIDCKNYVIEHADEMEEEVIARHIALYVNKFSIALGDQGREAIRFLLKEGFKKGLLAPVKEPIFNFEDL